MYAVLLLSYVVNAMDRQLFPVLAPDIRRQYAFSLAHIGLLSTIFTLGMAVAGLPTGYLLARFSRKAVLQLGIAIFSAGTVLTVTSAGFSDMLVWRAATGLGEAMQLTVMFAIAANYFIQHRGAAIGSVNFCYGIGAISGPILGGFLLSKYQSWQVPMIVFGVLGFMAMAIIALTVRPWFSETRPATHAPAAVQGASTLLNRNTILLTAMSTMGGLVIYGYLGMYPTFLREVLKYQPTQAGVVTSFYGVGALFSIIGGWVGDRYSPRLIMASAFLSTAALGYLFFHMSGAFATQATLSFLFGLIASSIIYVNLAAFHVKAVRNSLASRASGIFVTSFYTSAAAAGYVMGAIANQAGWLIAGEIQLVLLSLIGAGFALALRMEHTSS
ncbi:MAG: MFS transporter [Acidobacteria bacterium]|nr:MFS transporter [Acidobacteriota bacterium]